MIYPGRSGMELIHLLSVSSSRDLNPLATEMDKTKRVFFFFSTGLVITGKCTNPLLEKSNVFPLVSFVSLFYSFYT